MTTPLVHNIDLVPGGLYEGRREILHGSQTQRVLVWCWGVFDHESWITHSDGRVTWFKSSQKLISDGTWRWRRLM